jgi:microcystin-dependent protein
MYGGTSAPTGWLLCNGDAVLRSTYADLFTIVGETYGAGDGSLTFNLPDLRDRFAVGTGTTYSAGTTGGATSHSLTTSEMPQHTHTATSTVTDSGHTHTTTGISASEGGNGFVVTGGPSDWSDPGVLNSATTGITVATTNASTGGGFPHNNLPPYIGLAFIIKT